MENKNIEDFELTVDMVQKVQMQTRKAQAAKANFVSGDAVEETDAEEDSTTSDQ